MKSARSWIIVGIALVLGVLSIAITTWIFLVSIVSPQVVHSDVIIRNGTNLWITGGADALGLRWRNAQQITSLSVAQNDLGGIDQEWSDGVSNGWCELASAPIRTGALSIGWPLPWIICRFSAEKSIDSFPPSPEIADQIQVLTTASNRVVSWNGQFVMNTKTVLSALISTFVSACVWWSLLTIAIIYQDRKSKTIRHGISE